MPYSEAQPTYIGTGAGLGALGFTGANIVKRVLSKKPPKVSALKSYPASAAYGLLLGALTGNSITKKANVKEIDYTMNQDLLKACELAKLAADMTVPLEKKPAPAPGSDVVPGMTTNTVYDEMVAQEALAKAKEIAACGTAKTAADEAASRYQKAKEQVGKAYGYVKDKAGAGSSALDYAKAHKGRIGAGVAGLAAAGAAGAYAYNKLKEKRAAAYDYVYGMDDIVGYTDYGYDEMDYAEKLAAAEDYLTVDDAVLAMDAAESMYADAMEKLAFAEDLYGEAAEFIVACDELEKEAAFEDFEIDDTTRVAPEVTSGEGLRAGRFANAKARARVAKAHAGAKMRAAGKAIAANKGKIGAGVAGLAALGGAGVYGYNKLKEKRASEYAPLAGTAMGAAAGTTAGLALGSRFGGPRAGMVGAALGAAAGAVGGNVAGAAAPGALQHFKAALMG
jgi:hypothetical protein